MLLSRRQSVTVCSSALLLAACGGGGGGASGGGSASEQVLIEAGNGFGVLLPHQTYALGADGQPTGDVVALRTLDLMLEHVRANNPIHAPIPWPTTALLPGGTPGNHFIVARLKQPLDPESVFDRSGAGGATGLAGGVVALSLAADGTTENLSGRTFVGGVTLGSVPGTDGLLPLERWVAKAGDGVAALLDVDGDGAADYATAPGTGFPGTEGGMSGAVTFVDPRVLVFVADTDQNLATHETFPSGVQIELALTQALAALNGETLSEPALITATVGADLLSPEVLESGGEPVIVPGGGDLDVDPQTTVAVRFTEPVQPWTLGDLPVGGAPSLSSAIFLQFGPTTALTQVPFHARPFSVFDLTLYELVPAFAFPGTGPAAASCGLFGQVEVLVHGQGFEDLAGNTNAGAPATTFTTGSGPGIVNAPIAPEALYVGRVGAQASLSVVDLNGFGFGTGNPAWDPTCPWSEGNSNSRNDPNVLLSAPNMIPSLTPGSCTFSGGSSGPFTLTLDSNLDDRLVSGSTLLSISDMALGHALDSVFNNGSPFGCQAGIGNQCATSNYKSATFTVTGTQTITLTGFENLIEFAPHPNPPPLVYPPPCVQPYIGGQEPTSVDVTSKYAVSNLLQPGGLPFGLPDGCVPPDGLASPKAHVSTNFGGPSPQPMGGSCPPYMVRQQVGHFLYVADRAAGEVVVLNSNRMSVIDRIPLPDPTSFAMSPNLDLLAVTNQGADSVSFIGVEPGLPQFHTVIKTVKVGHGPTGIAWEPGNEDILVCNTGGNTVSVISSAGLTVRKTLSNQLSGPLDIAVTPRQLGFGMQRYVYYAYVLNADGKVSVFESGPDGVNGWGYDEIIGVLPFTFREPRAIQPDPVSMNSGFWVAHQDQLGATGLPTGLQGGAITNVAVTGGTLGMLFLGTTTSNPAIRDLQWGVKASIGSDQLTGIPSDLAFDDWSNVSVYPNFTTPYSPGPGKNYNGKGMLRQPPGSAPTLANTPVTLYAAVPVSSEGLGVVDVIDIGAGNLRLDTNPFQPGVQSIAAPGAGVLMHYFRQ
jgi:hypothetical protein